MSSVARLYAVKVVKGGAQPVEYPLPGLYTRAQKDALLARGHVLRVHLAERPLAPRRRR